MIDITNIFTVYEVTSHIKHILENSVGAIQIEGEIANLSRPSSGHIYFSLKDEKSIIRCVNFKTWKSEVYTSYEPKNGDKVIVSGRLTVYERDGNYQILVNNITPSGKGMLHLQFEQLKEKLKNEGLFNTEHRKKLPKYPKAIGIVTSETGAVLQDIINIISRRYPLDIYLYPSLVQGSGAAENLVKGIQFFPSNNIVDLIIICRGGGSYEDLFCFNDETLARTIFNCPIPVISAVGHETDFTICDFVADVRAATPSEAAEIAVPNRSDLLINLQDRKKQISSIVMTKLQMFKHKLLQNENKLKEKHPQNMIYKYKQNIDNLSIRIEKYKTKFDTIKQNHNIKIESFRNKYSKVFDLKRIELEKKKIILESLSPKNILEKGYSIIEKDNNIINSVIDLKNDDRINIILKDGKCIANVKTVNR